MDLTTINEVTEETDPKEVQSLLDSGWVLLSVVASPDAATNYYSLGFAGEPAPALTAPPPPPVPAAGDPAPPTVPPGPSPPPPPGA